MIKWKKIDEKNLPDERVVALSGNATIFGWVSGLKGDFRCDDIEEREVLYYCSHYMSLADWNSIPKE